jgi:hypothetical protein
MAKTKTRSPKSPVDEWAWIDTDPHCSIIEPERGGGYHDVAFYNMPACELVRLIDRALSAA